MLPWPRPAPPDGFEAHAARLTGEVRGLVVVVGKPKGEHFVDRDVWTLSWRGLRHKEALLPPTPGLVACYWCEQLRSGNRELDVEHYRPKVRVTRWEGRPPIVSEEPPPERNAASGYWWLAFRWDNYALSCKTCNSHWKRNLFPLDGGASPCREGEEEGEPALLLRPGVPFRTADHFEWTVDGHMLPHTEAAYATLVTCGLNRFELVAARKKVLGDARFHLEEFIEALQMGDDRRQRFHWKRLLSRGARGSEFAGMVRWQVERALGVEWGELEGAPD